MACLALILWSIIEPTENFSSHWQHLTYILAFLFARLVQSNHFLLVRTGYGCGFVILDKIQFLRILGIMPRKQPTSKGKDIYLFVFFGQPDRTARV